MTYLFLFFGSVLIVFLLSLLIKLCGGKGGADDAQKGADGTAAFVRCPVCSTPLAKNENLRSRVFRPMDTPDQRMTVQGCPHCFPVPEPGVSRSCPVCKKPLPLDGDLLARLFNRTKEKKHVMIVGCKNCNKR